MKETSYFWPPDMPLERLNESYFAFVKELPVPLENLAQNRQLFTGKGETTELLLLQEIHPLVSCLPWLFCEAFPSITENDLIDIGEAGMFLSLALLLRDNQLDGDLSSDPGIFFLHQELYTAALRGFHKLFDAQSQFWHDHFNSYLKQYTIALLQEEYNHRQNITPYSLEMMWAIGCGKAALLKTITTALALKAEEKTCVPRLKGALDALTAALQLGDDILDWAEDYQNRKYTYPLTLVIPVEQWPKPALSLEEISQRFENSVILETLLQQVEIWFQEALKAVANLPCTNWQKFVHCFMQSIHDYRQTLVARKLLKTISPVLVEN